MLTCCLSLASMYKQTHVASLFFIVCCLLAGCICITISNFFCSLHHHLIVVYQTNSMLNRPDLEFWFWLASYHNLFRSLVSFIRSVCAFILCDRVSASNKFRYGESITTLLPSNNAKTCSIAFVFCGSREGLLAAGIVFVYVFSMSALAPILR